MSTSFQYGDVSPARYPDFESKRKRRGSTPSADHGRKKKKESKKKETVIPSSSSSSPPPEGSIQQLVPVGLDAFVKDNVVVEERDPLTVLQEYRDQGNVTEEVLQEDVSVLQPTQDLETQTALQELIQELIEPPSPPTLPDYLVCLTKFATWSLAWPRTGGITSNAPCSRVCCFGRKRKRVPI